MADPLENLNISLPLEKFADKYRKSKYFIYGLEKTAEGDVMAGADNFGAGDIVYFWQKMDVCEACQNS